jgi:hypothetical protein
MLKYDPSQKFVLRSGSFYVGRIDAQTLDNPLVTDRAQAMVMDSRDNEQAKASFFSALHQAPFIPEKV